MDPTASIVMALLRLFLTRVVSGVALHATVTVRAGVRASAGCGENPRSDAGPATANPSAATTAPTNITSLLIPLHLSLAGRRKRRTPTPITQRQQHNHRLGTTHHPNGTSSGA